MKAQLRYDAQCKREHQLNITGSKSESNRLLILQALFPQITIDNLSDSDDTQLLYRALEDPTPTIVDIHHAGTAMRFLTAYFAALPGAELVLTGSQRMKERPIAILVDALRGMGATIEYTDKDGFPPLRITGKQLEGGAVRVAAGTSSQYISALLLIAPALSQQLELQLQGPVTSRPYIDMTCALLRTIGCEMFSSEDCLRVSPIDRVDPISISVESDWSSASYFYSIVALSEEDGLSLGCYKKDSLQGDARLATIYELFGVHTSFNASEEKIVLTKQGHPDLAYITLDLTATPDIAQTIAVTCLGLGLGCELTGLHTLKIKETDRLIAMKTELEKFGGTVEITKDSLKLTPSETINTHVEVETYNDHRMAMAFAPLALKTELTIRDPEVVSKSFPEFWKTIEKLGIRRDIQR